MGEGGFRAVAEVLARLTGIKFLNLSSEECASHTCKRLVNL